MTGPQQPAPRDPSTVRKLRGVLQETQPQFAARLGVAVVTVARWETTRPPRGAWLDKLADLAESRDLREYAQVFREARTSDTRPSAGRPVSILHEKDPEFRDERERRYTLALLRVLRNPKRYQKALRTVETTLAPVLADMTRRPSRPWRTARS